MQFFKKLFILVLILLLVNLYLPRIAFAQEGYQYARASMTGRGPESRTTEPKKIPTKKSKAWIWVVALLLVGGGIALAAGGGGGGGDDHPPTDGYTPTTGDVSVSW